MRGNKTKDKDEGQAKEAEMFQQIGRLQIDLEWLKKNLSSSNFRELRQLLDHYLPHSALVVSVRCCFFPDPRFITGLRKCANRRWDHG